MPVPERSPLRTRLGNTAASILVAGGLVAMLVGAGALLVTWYAGQSWAATDEAERATRDLAAETPQWIDEMASAPPSRPSLAAPPAVSVAPGEQVRSARALPPTDDMLPEATESVPSAGPASEPRAPADAVALVGSDFRFVDPPEPGARARITVTVRNRSDLPTGPLKLILPTVWLAGWKVIEADPPVLDDREEPDKRRVFVFPSLDPNRESTLLLGLIATDDAVDPPDLLLVLEQGQEIGQARPKTVSPRPRPGPARTVEIPSLRLRAAVVPTAWEPPAWVVGQIRGSANLSEGNTVLIGHLNGLVGNVFGDLNRLKLGDAVIATSRGLDYHFVVSEVVVLPGSESRPMAPSGDPRLTLMTCTGAWDPIRLDYSHRLWVIAEPKEQADLTLTGGPTPLQRQFGPLGLAPEPIAEPSPEPAGPAADAPTDAPETVAAAPTVEPAAESAPPLKGPDLDVVAARGGANPPPEKAQAVAPVEPPTVLIRAPAEGAEVGRRAVIRGARTQHADPTASLWLVVKADVEGSRWYLFGQPLTVKPDDSWEVDLELGGGPGVHHTIIVAPVDADTDALLRRHAAEHPGEPLSTLPEAFEGAAHIVVRRQ